jgi:hypothetical protein
MQAAHFLKLHSIDVVVGPEFVTGSPEWKLEPHKN